MGRKGKVSQSGKRFDPKTAKPGDFFSEEDIHTMKLGRETHTLLLECTFFFFNEKGITAQNVQKKSVFLITDTENI